MAKQDQFIRKSRKTTHRIAAVCKKPKGYPVGLEL